MMLGAMVRQFIDARGVVTDMAYKAETDKMTSLVVAGQKKVEMSYHESNKVSYSEDAFGHKTTFTYNAQGLPTTIAQPDGSQIRVKYDARGNITQLTHATGVVSRYEYDSLNRVVATIDGNNKRTAFAYDALDNMVQVRNAQGDCQYFEYNNNSKLTKLTDFNGAITTRAYNSLGKVEKVIDPLGRETSLAYDALWNVSELTQPNGAKTQFHYNHLNRLVRVVKADGSECGYAYDATGNRTTITDEAGHVTKLSYDELGQLIGVIDVAGHESSYTYDDAGRLISATDALGNVVEMTYDAADRLMSEMNVLGEVRNYTYTKIGKLATVTDELGRVTTYDYALGGVLTCITYPDGTTEHYEYDRNGNVSKHMGPTGVKTTYTYEDLNRVIKVSAAGEKHFTYDAVGNITSVVDELGNQMTYTYTLTGKLETVTDALGHQTAYQYDALDNLIAVCEGDERVTKYERDLLGHITSVIDPLGQIETYTYDVRGQLIEKVDKEGYLTTYAYTKQGDVSQIQYEDGREVEMGYNALRQLTEVKDWLGMTKIEVDALGRATKVTDHNDKTVTYTYGSAGQRTGIIYPDGKQVAYQYDQLGRLESVRDGENDTTYSYDDVSRLNEKTFSNGQKTKYCYNLLGQLTSLTHFESGNMVDQFAYGYDLGGNKNAIKKARMDLPNESGVFEYEYDPLNRLSEVLKNGETLRKYEYDAFGNRISLVESGIETSYRYNALNQLVSLTDESGQKDYVYDKRGNCTEVFLNGHVVNEYEFNPLNRLEKAINKENNLTTMYRYNGMGHRVGKVDGMNPTAHIDDVLDLTASYHNLLMRGEDHFVWDTGLLRINDTPYLLDELGSPLRFGDEAYAFDEFGQALHDASAVSQPFGFTGYQHDNGLYYAQARQYSPEIGRFISEDLVKGLAPAPFTLNSYAYCWNQPLNLVDLDGMLPQWLRNVGNAILDAGAVAVGTIGGALAVVDGVTLGAIYGLGGGVVGGIRGLVNGNGFVDGMIEGAMTGAMHGVAIGTAPGFELIGIAGQRFYNDDRGRVLESSFIDNYRGQVVIRIPGSSGMSLGPVMFLGRDASENLLLHEHGHFIEWQILDTYRYLMGIGLPSIRNSHTDNWRNFPELYTNYNGILDYNIQRWEINAEILGHVRRQDNQGNLRSHPREAIINGATYFAYLYFNSGLRGSGNVFSNAWDFSNHDFSTINKEG